MQERRYQKAPPPCFHCEGIKERVCPDCDGSGVVTEQVQSAPLEEWRRRKGAEFERNMLATLADFLHKNKPASLFFHSDGKHPIPSVSIPSPKNDVYGLIDSFETNIMAEDPEGYSASFENPEHPYIFYQRCRLLWDHWWHDLGHPHFPWPKSVLEMLNPGISDEYIILTAM